MKNFFAAVTCVLLSTVVFAGVTLGLNLLSETITLNQEVIVNGLILGGGLSAGAYVLTRLLRRTSRNPVWFGFALGFASIGALAVMMQGNFAHEALIGYGAIGVVGFVCGAISSGTTRLLYGPVPKKKS